MCHRLGAVDQHAVAVGAREPRAPQPRQEVGDHRDDGEADEPLNEEAVELTGLGRVSPDIDPPRSSEPVAMSLPSDSWPRGRYRTDPARRGTSRQGHAATFFPSGTAGRKTRWLAHEGERHERARRRLGLAENRLAAFLPDGVDRQLVGRTRSMTATIKKIAKLTMKMRRNSPASSRSRPRRYTARSRHHSSISSGGRQHGAQLRKLLRRKPVMQRDLRPGHRASGRPVQRSPAPRRP